MKKEHQGKYTREFIEKFLVRNFHLSSASELITYAYFCDNINLTLLPGKTKGQSQSIIRRIAKRIEWENANENTNG
jgi:hypothetical protein